MTTVDPVAVTGRRRAIQWVLAPIVILVIALGWKYPWLGFSVPVVMLMGIVGSLFNGRYVCGNLCPRGAFFDRLVAPLGRRGRIPPWFWSPVFRWVAFALLMGFMTYRLLQNPGDPAHWGRTFWLMCTVTTAVGLVLGLSLRARAWCAICPIGTVQSAVGGGLRRLRMDVASCRRCRACERACPFGIAIVAKTRNGTLEDRDCLKCSECLAVCPVRCLRLPAAREKESLAESLTPVEDAR